MTGSIAVFEPAIAMFSFEVKLLGTELAFGQTREVGHWTGHWYWGRALHRALQGGMLGTFGTVLSTFGGVLGTLSGVSGTFSVGPWLYIRLPSFLLLL